MNKVKKIFALLLIVAVISFGLTGCKDKGEHPTGESATKEHPTKEHPTEKSATEEHPTKEHPE